MHRDDDFRRIAKVLIIAVLCSELQSSCVEKSAPPKELNRYSGVGNAPEATYENAKHHASVRLKAQDRHFGDGHICSGAVIAPSVVLTVAHCTYNYSENTKRHPSELKVVMGTLNRYERTDNTLEYGVTHVYQPSTYDSQSLAVGIAIIMLERDIPEEHPTVQPIALSRDTEVELEQATAGYAVTSWAVTEEGMATTQLLRMNATRLKEQSCAESARPGTSCIALSSSVREAFPFDAGAPLIRHRRLVGLLAHGKHEGSAPLTYTSVHQHVQWISEKIGDGTNQNSSAWGLLGFLLFTAFTLRSTGLVKNFH